MKKIFGMLFLACIMAFFGCKKDDSVSGQGDTNDCFYFEAVDAGSVVSMVRKSWNGYDGSYRENADKAPDVSLEYSLDKSNWLPFVVEETKVSLDNAGDRVYIRAKNRNDNFGCYNYIEDQTRLYDWNNFSASERVKVGGNIMYLLDGTGSKKDFDTLSNKYVFYGLFWDMDKLTDASKLTLPAKTLAEYCYSSMFSNTSLTVAPELPATTLAEFCYSSMFSNTSLTVAPELPATTLAEYCYSDMFSSTSLTVAPELPAKTLAEGCYFDMFHRCTSLTVAPELSAKILEKDCYLGMFSGCTSLTVAPELSAKILEKDCYLGMFSGCTSLTVAPKMLATTLAEGGCYKMFNGCSSLQSIEVNFTEWIQYGTERWLQGVSETGTFTCPAELDVTERGDTYIPYGWTIVTK